MAPQAGFEPATDRLTADCSTTELLRSIRGERRRLSGFIVAFRVTGEQDYRGCRRRKSGSGQKETRLVDPVEKAEPEVAGVGVGDDQTLEHLADEDGEDETAKWVPGAVCIK